MAANRVTEALEAIHALETLLSSVRSAETAQRGFLLTNDEAYAQPFDVAVAAVPGEIAVARSALADRPVQRRRLDELERVIGDKIDELRKTMAFQRNGDQAGRRLRAGGRRSGRVAAAGRRAGRTGSEAELWTG